MTFSSSPRMSKGPDIKKPILRFFSYVHFSLLLFSSYLLQIQHGPYWSKLQNHIITPERGSMSTTNCFLPHVVCDETYRKVETYNRTR